MSYPADTNRCSHHCCLRLSQYEHHASASINQCEAMRVIKIWSSQNPKHCELLNQLPHLCVIGTVLYFTSSFQIPIASHMTHHLLSLLPVLWACRRLLPAPPQKPSQKGPLSVVPAKSKKPKTGLGRRVKRHVPLFLLRCDSCAPSHGAQQCTAQNKKRIRPNAVWIFHLSASVVTQHRTT